MVTWELIRDGSDNIDTLYDVELTDTANPFGDFAICKIDDSGGELFDKFPRGTRIELQVTPTDATTAISKFVGFVVERRGLNQAGADALEIEAYSFDQFLRQNTVSNDLRGLSLFDALKSIVTNDTPVDFVAANVAVGDPQEVTRSFRGEKVETALQALAFKSQDEAFSVNDNLEFTFGPRETRHIDRGIDDTFYFDYDIPELSNESVNEVEVFFDEGNRRVLIDDGQDKLDVQNALGLPEPATQRAEIQRPQITDIGDAEDEGRQFLELRNATLTGQVVTFGILESEPGDTINVQITARGIDTEFTIASVQFLWGRDETILTVVERKGNDNSEVIVRLSESTKRVEMEGADRDAARNRITSTEAVAGINPVVSTLAASADEVRVTNTLRNITRDGFAGGPLPDIDTIAVGLDETGLSRSNTSLGNRIDTASASQSFPSASSVEYSATVSAPDGFQEVGLFDSSGNLLVRAIYNDTQFNTNISVRLDIDDASGPRSVVTIEGQETVRDIIADSNPVLPDKYLYGTGDSAPDEFGASLDNRVTSQSLNSVLLLSADTEQEFTELVGGIADDVPLTTSGGALQLQQTCFTTDSPDFVTSNTILDQDSVFSSGFAEGVTDTSSTITITFTVTHRIPADNFSLLMRLRTAGTGQGIECTFNGTTWQPAVDGADFGSINYRELAQNSFGGNASTYTAAGGGDVEPGTFDLTVRATDDTGDTQKIDLIAPRDGRFNVTQDNQVNSSGGFLDGPELFPEQVTVSLPTGETRRDVTEASVSSTFNDVSNNQFIELANDGTNFTRINNSDSPTVTFASPDRGVDTNIGLSRFGTRTGETPLTGFNGQSVSDFQLFADPDAVVGDDIGVSLTRAIVPPGTITGNTIREAGLKGSVVLLTRHVFAGFEVDSNDTVTSSELTGFKQD
jgi:hypothetical protein